MCVRVRVHVRERVYVCARVCVCMMKEEEKREYGRKVHLDVNRITS